MQEWTNTYMIVLKTTVYLYHLYLAFSSAKIFFPTIFLKNSQTNKLQKTHTIPSVCFTFSFQIALSLLFYSKPRWQHTFLKHKRNPCTGNNLQFYFFFFRHLQRLLHISPGGQQHSTLRRAKHLNMLAPSYM